MDFGLCQKIANYIMRPPRTTYQIQDLGPKTFQHRSHIYQRLDFNLLNQRHSLIQCSLFKQKHNLSNKQTIIFLHANSSSRLAVKNYLPDLLPFFNVACLDCAGSGISQGKYVTLGYYQKEDLRALIKYLKRQFFLTKFILWGRSMGAVTSLLYAAKYNDVQAVVSDNSFSDLQETCKQLKNSYLSIFPDFLLQTLLESTQQYIDQNMNNKQKLSFKLNKLKPKQVVGNIKCPIFYIYSQNDKIVNNQHTKKLYELSNYPKRIMGVKGDHNGHRDGDIKGRVIDYLLDLSIKKKKIEQCEQLIQSSIYINNINNSNINNNSINNQRSNQRSNQLIDKKSNKIIVQNKQKLVYESPLNENLCRSYLNNNNRSDKIDNGSEKRKYRNDDRLTRESILGIQQQQYNLSRKYSIKLDNNKITSYRSQSCIDLNNNNNERQLKLKIKQYNNNNQYKNSQLSTNNRLSTNSQILNNFQNNNVLGQQLKQQQSYKLQTNQFSKARTSCFDSCQSIRKRKKIFSKH